MTSHALAGLALLGSALAAAAQPPGLAAAPPAQPTQTAGNTILAIPIPEIAQRAEQAATLLRAAQSPDATDFFDDADLELRVARRYCVRRFPVSTLPEF